MTNNPLITIEIETFIKTRRFLDAVRTLMSKSGISLLEAKRTVDTYRIEVLGESPEPQNTSMRRAEETKMSFMNDGPTDLLGEPDFELEEEESLANQKIPALIVEIQQLIDKETHDSTVLANEKYEQFLDIIAEDSDEIDNLDKKIDSVAIAIYSAIINHVPEQAATAVKELKDYTTKNISPEFLAKCLFSLYVAYSEGIGVESNPGKAYEYLSEASFTIDEGDTLEPDIFVGMAQCHIKGWGVDPNEKKAQEFYILARDWKTENQESPAFGKPVSRILKYSSIKVFQMLMQKFDPDTANSTCNVKLINIGSDKRAIRTLLVEQCNLSVGDAVKQMVQVSSGIPFVFSEGIVRSEAEELVARIRVAGGTAEIE